MTAGARHLFEEASFTVYASVEDDGGSENVASVSFLVDGVVVYTDSEAPFSVLLEAPANRADSYIRIIAVATDFDGVSGASEPLDLLIKPLGNGEGVGQSLSIYTQDDDAAFIRTLLEEGRSGYSTDVTLIAEGASFVVGSLLDFTLSASDGAYDSVEFFINGSSIGSTRYAQPIVYQNEEGEEAIAEEFSYRVSYVIPENLAGRGMIVSAVGTKGERQFYSESIGLEARANAPPIISFVNPANLGAVRSGDLNSFQISVTDDLIVYGSELVLEIVDLQNPGDSVVLRQESKPGLFALRNGLFSAGTEQFEFLVPIPESPTGSRFEARLDVTDYHGLVSTENIEVVVQPNQVPQIEFISPVDASSWVAGTSLPIEVSVLDDGAIRSGDIQYFVNGERVTLGSSSIEYPIPTELAGSRMSIVASVSDSDGLVGTDEVEVWVTSDTIPPSVVIAEPAHNTIVQIDETGTALIGFLVTGFDNIGLDSLTVYESGAPGEPLANLGAEEISSNEDGSFLAAMSTLLEAGFVEDGEALDFFVQAVDSSGNAARSAAVSLTFREDVIAPLDIALSYPRLSEGEAGLPYFDVFEGIVIDFLAVVPENALVDRVRLLDSEGIEIFSDTDGAPYQFAYTVPAVVDATNLQYTLIAEGEFPRATPTAASFDFELRVQPDTEGPELQFLSPRAGDQLVEGVEYPLSVSVRDNVAIDAQSVEFSIDGGSTWLDAQEDFNSDAFGRVFEAVDSWQPVLVPLDDYHLEAYAGLADFGEISDPVAYPALVFAELATGEISIRYYRAAGDFDEHRSSVEEPAELAAILNETLWAEPIVTPVSDQRFDLVQYAESLVDGFEDSTIFELTARAFDHKAQVGEAEVAITVLRDAFPHIEIVEPVEFRPVYAGETLPIGAVLRDDLGISSIRVSSWEVGERFEVSITDQAAINGLADEFGQLQLLDAIVVPPLPNADNVLWQPHHADGVGYLRFEVTDSVGQVRTTRVPVRVIADDETPIVSVSAPISGTDVLKAEQLSLEIEAQDNRLIESINVWVEDEFLVELNLDPQEIVPETRTFFVPDPNGFGSLIQNVICSYALSMDVDLRGLSRSPEINSRIELVVEAIDINGNVGRAASVFLDVVPDRLPPFLEVLSPVEGEVFYATEGAEIEVSLELLDNLDTPEDLLVQVTLRDENAGSVVVLSEGDELYVYPYMIPEVLEETEFRIEVSAEDLAGNIGRALPVNFTVLPPALAPIEDNAPVLTNAFPEDDSVILSEASYVPSVVVTDDTGIQSVVFIESDLPLSHVDTNSSELAFTLDDTAQLRLLNGLELTTSGGSGDVVSSWDFSTPGAAVLALNGGLMRSDDTTLTVAVDWALPGDPAHENTRLILFQNGIEAGSFSLLAPIAIDLTSYAHGDEVALVFSDDLDESAFTLSEIRLLFSQDAESGPIGSFIFSDGSRVRAQSIDGSDTPGGFVYEFDPLSTPQISEPLEQSLAFIAFDSGPQSHEGRPGPLSLTVMPEQEPEIAVFSNGEQISGSLFSAIEGERVELDLEIDDLTGISAYTVTL